MDKMIVPFSPPDITEEEIEAVSEVLRSGWITTGPKTKQLEKELALYMGTERAVCLNSATACLEMTLRVLGIGPGDEVITSAYTYTASASPVIHVGAKLVLVDTAPDSYEMDYEKLAAAVTERTKAIIPVDLGGIMCDYDRIFQIVREKAYLFHPSSMIQEKLGRIAVVADGAHAFGACRKGKICGQAADFTTFSFHAVKNLTTGEGGAVTWHGLTDTDGEELYHQYMLLSLHGQSKDALAKTQLGAWEYDIAGTYYKCNMTDIMAAVGLVQLKRYSYLEARRRAIIEKYNERLSDLPVHLMDHYGENQRSSGHLYLVRLAGKSRENCNEIIRKMAEDGVATNVHYKPLPMMTAYRKLGFDIKDYPNSQRQYENEITLPLHTKLTDKEVEYVIRTFRKYVQ